MNEIRQPENKKVLCIFGRLLGGKSFSAELDTLLAEYPHLDCFHIDFEGRDYANYPAPAYTKISASLEAAVKLKNKYKAANPDIDSFDAIFFQSMHLTMMFKSIIANKKTIIALDTTPKVAHQGNAQARGLKAYIRSKLAYLLEAFYFKPIFNNCDFFLARTEVVKKSLENDYGVSANKIVATYIPLDIAPPKPKQETTTPKIIFVGNDFNRKGGPFLLDLYKNHLAPFAELTIISSDQKISQYDLPKGVTWLSKLPREQVLAHYRQSDIFVLPTWKDDLGLAICEAIACGLPVVVRDSTAQRELVKQGQSGYLMPYKSTEQEWSEALLSLIKNPQQRHEFSQQSLAHAKALFSRDIFKDKFEQALREANLL